MVATEPTTSEPTTSVEVLSLNLSVTRDRTWDGEQLMDEKFTVLEDSSETMVIEEGNWVDTLDHEDLETQGKAICWIVQSLRERLKIGRYRRVKITKNMELFKAKSMTYTKLTITVSFSDLIDTSFQYDLLWAAAVSQQ
jgi:hypothetical protein